MKTKIQSNPTQGPGANRGGLVAQLLQIAANLAWNAF
jgi:hypothetical protein